MKYLSRKSLAEWLDCSPQTVDRKVRSGELPAPKLIAGLRRWDVDDLAAVEKSPARRGRFGLSSDPDEVFGRPMDEIRKGWRSGRVS